MYAFGNFAHNFAVQADQPIEVLPRVGKNSTQGKAGKGIGGQVKPLTASTNGKLNICILSADFWGLKSAGGTATAYHLLAAVLGQVDNFEVCFLTRVQMYPVHHLLQILS